MGVAPGNRRGHEEPASHLVVVEADPAADRLALAMSLAPELLVDIVFDALDDGIDLCLTPAHYADEKVGGGREVADAER